MNKFIDLATGRLRAKLSDKKAFYEIDDLRSAGIPDNIIQPLKQELVNQLHRDLEMPLTEWANLNREPVHNAWDHFMEKAEEKVRLPDYKVNAFFKAIINKIYPLLIWPRTQIPKFIFGDNEEMGRNEIAARVEKMPVKQKLGSAVMRYMNKKNVDQLSREKCQDIVEKIDVKLTERYSDQQWFQSILPVFQLAAGPVPTDLLASYFFHRDQRSWSNELAQMGGQISEEDFKEWLGYTEQAEDQSRQVKSEKTTAGKSVAEQFEPKTVEKSKSSREKGQTTGAESQSKSEANINAQFTSKDEVEELSEERADTSRESLEDQPQSAGDKSSSTPKDHDRSESSDSEEDEPIWRRFLSSSDQVELEPIKKEDQKSEDSTASPQRDNNYQLNELFKENNGGMKDKAAQQLNEYLEGQREYFIQEIFRGSLSAYEQAIRTLSGCEDWQEAYPFIDREIFDRNNIDLYSQPALYFTDVMQGYFENN